jgi:hypothetical protein
MPSESCVVKSSSFSPLRVVVLETARHESSAIYSRLIAASASGGNTGFGVAGLLVFKRTPGRPSNGIGWQDSRLNI